MLARITTRGSIWVHMFLDLVPWHDNVGSNPVSQIGGECSATTDNESWMGVTGNLMRIVGKKDLNSIHVNQAMWLNFAPHCKIQQKRSPKVALHFLSLVKASRTIRGPMPTTSTAEDGNSERAWQAMSRVNGHRHWSMPVEGFHDHVTTDAFF